jgi:two-component system chemotaxis sensor kinase CheA
MTLDLTQFHGIFFEEGFEALDTMESALLKLDVGAPDPERINTIFRVAHSIKGGSATFGFTAIASFTHSLETMLDEMRSGRMHVTQAISDILLKSVDVMREMLRAVQNSQPINSQRVADLQFDLELAIAQKETSPPPAPAPVVVADQPQAAPVAAAPVVTAPSVTTPAAAPEPATSASPTPRWQIDFKPHPELLKRGNDPLRMLRELESIGTLRTTVNLDSLPPFDGIDPHACFLAWSLELEGPESEQKIRDVFDWAEGDCDLTITRVDAPQEPIAAVEAFDVAVADADESATSPVAEAIEAPAVAAEVPASAAIPAAGSASVTPIVEAVATPAGAAELPAVAPVVAAAPAPAAKAAAKEPGHAASDSSSIRVSVEKIDELMNTVGELVITQAMLSQLGQRMEGPDAEQFRSSLAQLERNMRGLQESVMRVRMLPISFVFSRFPRMARDLAQRLGKQIDLKLTGQETELDKTVMEKIGDPLVHLVRNSIDHGIEMPDVRVAKGKTALGTVHLDAYHRGGNIAVEVSDDGAGLDKDRILAKARSRGLIGQNDTLTDEQVYDLIFLPGFSTAEKTTDVSGRGVGMDVVRRNVNELGGKIEIKSFPGKGSRFVISLPLTLAIVDGQSVAVGGETYIVPLVSIVESMQLKKEQVSRLAGRAEVISFRGDYLPIIRLHETFGVEPRSRELHEGLIVVAEGDGRRVGLFVDDLLGQQQVVIKSLETNYGRIDGVSGATILGDGSVSLILDLPGLIRAASMSYAA